MSIKTDLLEILADYVECPIEEVDSSAPFKLATGLDSFVLFSFVAAVEEHFEISIPNDELKTMSSLDDIVAYITSIK